VTSDKSQHFYQQSLKLARENYQRGAYAEAAVSCGGAAGICWVLYCKAGTAESEDAWLLRCKWAKSLAEEAVRRNRSERSKIARKVHDLWNDVSGDY